jgi:hypothetical protein
MNKYASVDCIILIYCVPVSPSVSVFEDLRGTSDNSDYMSFSDSDVLRVIIVLWSRDYCYKN